MSNRSSSDSGAGVIAGAVILGGVCFWVYTILKGWADAIGLDVRSLMALLSGGAVVLTALGVAHFLGLSKRMLSPWALPLMGISAIPAMDYRASLVVTSFPYGGDEGMVWFGTWWGQGLIVLGLALVAHFLMKFLDDRY